MASAHRHSCRLRFNTQPQSRVHQSLSLPVSSYSVPPSYSSNPTQSAGRCLWYCTINHIREPHWLKNKPRSKKEKKSQQHSLVLSWTPAQVNEQHHKCITLKLLKGHKQSQKNPKVKKLFTKLKYSPSGVTHLTINEMSVQVTKTIVHNCSGSGGAQPQLKRPV